MPTKGFEFVAFGYNTLYMPPKGFEFTLTHTQRQPTKREDTCLCHVQSGDICPPVSQWIVGQQSTYKQPTQVPSCLACVKDYTLSIPVVMRVSDSSHSPLVLLKFNAILGRSTAPLTWPNIVHKWPNGKPIGGYQAHTSSYSYTHTYSSLGQAKCHDLGSMFQKSIVLNHGKDCLTVSHNLLAAWGLLQFVVSSL